jgi:parallel beta-helix repeat protein
VYKRQGRGEPSKLVYIVHSPISIEGDAELISTATSESWPGSGLPVDPYIISSYSINGTGYDHCIEIEDTTLHLVIRYNNLYDCESGHGLSLDTCSNVTISNNTVEDCFGSSQIYIKGCSGVSIDRNQVKGGGSQHGIRITDSKQVKVSSNEITDCYWYGIYSRECHDLEIENNSIQEIGGTGIYINILDGLIASQNSISNCLTYGITTDYASTGLVFHSNMLTGCGFSIGTIRETEIASNNTVDGVPVRQYVNQDLSSLMVPIHTSQFFLQNVTNFHLSGLDYSMGYELLRAFDSKGITIDNCIFSGGKSVLYFLSLIHI